MKKILLILTLTAIVAGCGDNGETETTDGSGESQTESANNTETDNSEDETTDADTETDSETSNETDTSTEEVEPVELTEAEKTTRDLVSLMEEENVYDAGSYVEGDIPKGEYAFVRFSGSGQYYGEEDTNGNIIGNHNFDSFGYVHVHNAGNITASAILVGIDELEELGVSGAKELYEKLNNESDYKQSGFYKVGTDIEPGEYTIESVGQAYVSVLSGPVSNNEIVQNNNFNGKYSVNVKEGQYLNISGGKIIE
ncbi:membrane lipoprotein lipid attachment site-containing protein [Alkalibacillus almallahensis]|uniref:membrane lipoprotein lipid attachment site-containing protein n=1 Tax=Alkalibacillus almallahensis TaxID=1379154 RepID=UPI00141D7A9A|nr:membrane lipoprotein lipid attachment site-containing protein [Alkalibacillus almallahensis]NIK10911.1 hypothetical protein [Alkalibacillus almallahensis]